MPWHAPSEVVRICNARGMAKASSPSAAMRKKFWLDRARTAAISKHTNAFKLNEDVVIPAAAHGRLLRRHRAHQYRAVDQEQARAMRPVAGVFRWTDAAAPYEEYGVSAALLADKVAEARTLVAAIPRSLGSAGWTV